MQNDLDRADIGGRLSASRLICGLWQVADLEKDSGPLDAERSADALQAYVEAGFDTFDMADHYGSAEVIATVDDSDLTGETGKEQCFFHG